MYWKITPYHNRNANDWVCPANEDGDQQALTYAQDRIEEAWDQAEVGKPVSITIELCEGDCPEDLFGD